MSARVLKGNVVPARNPSGGISLVTEAPGPDTFRSFLSDLRRFLEEAVKLSGIEQASPEEKLELISDLIALFYKAPLLREPVEGLHLSPFKVYLAYRILRRSLPSRMAMKDLMRVLLDQNIEDQLTDLFNILDVANERVETVLTGYPADTRPGYNVSSLMIHWITVSALAWARGYRLGLGRRELARLRIASLLHDVGKPLEPKEHVSKGVEEVKNLLQGLVDQEDLNAIVEIVASHHARDYRGPHFKEVQAIREADHFSSGIDRLGVLVREIVLKELASITHTSEEEAFRKFYSSGSWEAWEELEAERPGVIKELTEKCVKALILREVGMGGGAPFGETTIIKLDVASIQSFIRESEKLPLLAASSYIVDLAVMFNSLRSVQETLSSGKYGVWYPVEGFLYSAGGNILAIAPDGLVDGVTEALKTSFKKEGNLALGFGPLHVRIATARLRSDYGEIMKELDLKLLSEKISLVGPLNPGEDPYEKSRVEGLTGIERTCDYCKKRPAVSDVKIRGESFFLCEECGEKYQLFRKGHVRSKWKRALTTSGRTVENAFGLDWERGEEGKRAQDVLIELIAGHDSPEEVERERLLNVAVLKVDGNLMGAFMARSISLSDALERSARVDLALKRAFRAALKALHEGLRSFNGKAADREEARLLIGLQYMGGDDALIFSPSWASIPLAVVLMVEFAREMGYLFWIDKCAHTGATLSIGLAAAPARHNIWALLDASDELLDEAKFLGRYPVFMGAIAFDVTEGGLLTGRAVSARKETLLLLRLTAQPWVIGPVGEANRDPLWSLREDPIEVGEAKPALGRHPDLMRFLSLLFELKIGDEDRPWLATDDNLRNFYAKMFESVYREYISEKESEKGKKEGKGTRLKRLRNITRVLEALPGRFDVSPGEVGYESMVRLFAASKAREGRDSESLYRVIAATFTPEGTALEDVNRLCKIMLGGAR